MGPFDKLLEALKYHNPRTDAQGNDLTPESMKAMTENHPVISGTPGPAPALPEIEPVSGAPLLNNGILAQLAARKKAQDAATISLREPASEAPVEQMKAAHPSSVPARPMPTSSGAQIPVALDLAAKPDVIPGSPYGSELNDDALKAAMAQRDQQLRNGMLARATQQFAVASGGGYTKPDFSTAEQVEKNASIPVEDIQTRRKSKDAETTRESSLLSLSNERDMSSPDSDISKSVRDFAKDKLGMKVRGNESVKQMQAILPLYEKYQSRQDTLNEKREARADKIRADREKKTEGATEGQKALDKKYASDYNSFIAGGAGHAKASLVKLKAIRDELANDKGLTQAGGGTIAGSLPDWARRQKSVERRDNSIAAANAGLKAIFPGALSDDERKSAASEFYNDKLDNAANVKVMDSKIKEMEESLRNETAKAKHFQRKGSLTGFEDSTALNRPKNEAPHQGKYPAGSIVTVKGRRYRVGQDGDSLEEAN